MNINLEFSSFSSVIACAGILAFWVSPVAGFCLLVIALIVFLLGVNHEARAREKAEAQIRNVAVKDHGRTVAWFDIPKEEFAPWRGATYRGQTYGLHKEIPVSTFSDPSYFIEISEKL
jgi:hypothetical protein